jgi:Carboxypeptidase regulatory-like domain
MLKALVRISILVALVVICQGTWALAVTTGALSGYIRAQGGAGLANAKVTVTAPSESSNTTTDTAGHYVFVSLIPDTYTITASKDGYTTLSQPGVTVIAGNTQTVSLVLQPAVKTLGVVTTTAAAALVKPGTTNDVYSVNEASQAKVAAMGGGGSLNQAYSAIATTPGAVVPPGGMGWFQTVYIRGGDYDQIGYEFDGIPVLRSYDNYPQTSANTLGQQELQVYTGAPPADSQNQGLAGYINQVIKSGTYPGFATLNTQLGTPALYNAYNFEVGGGTPDRNFTYFLGSSVSSSAPRAIDQFNGASYQQQYGVPFAKLPCPTPGDANYAACYASGIGPAGYLLSPPIMGDFASYIGDRENVINLHFGIPHSNDSGKDDIQLLYDAQFLNTYIYSSPAEFGFTDPAYQAAYGAPSFPYYSGAPFGYQYTGQVGAPLAPNYQAKVAPAYFPYQPNSVGPFPQFIPLNQQDGTENPNNIVKLQYQKNFGTNAYFRIYGYSDYSLWPEEGPNTLASDYEGYVAYNYFVRTLTNGGSMEYGDQINDKNLISIALSDSTATDYRDNNYTPFGQLLLGTGSPYGPNNFAYVVNAKNPQDGICYNAAGTAISCYSTNALAFSLPSAAAGAPLPTLPASCSGGPCEWYVTENGLLGGGNYAKPNFGVVSVTDQIKASSQWFFNVGAREDRFFYQLSDTNCPAEATAAGCARQFWFNSWDNSYCVLPGGGQLPFYNSADDTAVGSACPKVNGIQTSPAIITNLPNDTESFYVFEPRFGTTFTANADNVLRFSYGRVDQAPNTAFEQYNLLEQNLPSYLGPFFWPVGFTSTTHAIYPPTANDVDLSWEHHFAGTEASLKLTPYYRSTNNQIQNFFLNQKTGFVSGLNVGQQTSDGLEFQMTWGNFNENGLSALLSYTYNNSYIVQKQLGTGGTVYDTINLAIQEYNSFTKACAGVAPNTSTTSLCGTFGGSNAVATYASGVANPYYNAPAQGRLNPSGDYIPFSTIPGGIEAGSGSYEVPHSGALVLNFKHDRWAISPQFQFFAGSYYGDPLSGYGVNPADCTELNASGSVAGDPRYPYGGTGSPYDATSCTGTLAIPDPYTHVFDGLGVFRQPNQFLAHAQLSYQASSRITFVANVANLVDTCFGGSKEPWTVNATHAVCDYGLPGWGAPLPYGANIYNPGSTFQPVAQFPYQEDPDVSPIEAYFQMKISL